MLNRALRKRHRTKRFSLLLFFLSEALYICVRLKVDGLFALEFSFSIDIENQSCLVHVYTD